MPMNEMIKAFGRKGKIYLWSIKPPQDQVFCLISRGLMFMFGSVRLFRSLFFCDPLAFGKEVGVVGKYRLYGKSKFKFFFIQAVFFVQSGAAGIGA